MNSTEEASSPTETENQEDKEIKFKPWKCGEPYNLALPETDGNPWTFLQESWLKKDKIRCDIWKEEVQYLLIFAGLFSAVVTAFVVESYKGLQQDPDDVSAIILSRILAQMEGAASSRTSSSQQNPTSVSFSPTIATVRINALWFLSLVFSLATVLFGIVSLQWLREYQRPTEHLPPRLSYSLQHMHAEALEKWYVPQIFGALPILLQIALALFLVGIVDFLWQLSHAVAIPSLVAIAFILIFLSVATVLPALQALSLFVRPRTFTKCPRVQCPYKSPQSWAFHRLIAIIIHSVMRALGKRRPLQRVRHDFPSLSANAGPLSPSAIPMPPQSVLPEVPKATDIMFQNSTRDTWIEHGIAWLYQRDTDCISAHATIRPLVSLSATQSPIPIPLYDTVHSLLKAKETRSSRQKGYVYAAFTCFDEVSRLIIYNHKQGSLECVNHNSYLRHLLDSSQFKMPDLDPNDAYDFKTLTLLHDINNLAFQFAGEPLFTAGSPSEFEQRALEIWIRLTDFMFAHEPKNKDYFPFLEARATMVGTDDHNSYDSLVRNLMKRHDTIILPGLARQALHILEHFYQNASQFHPKEANVGDTSYTNECVLPVLGSLALIISYEKDDPAVRSQQDSIFEFIAGKLEQSLLSTVPVPQTDQKQDYLFYSALLYTSQLYRHSIQNVDKVRISDSLRNLATRLLEYKSRMRRRKDLEACFGLSEKKHGFDVMIGQIMSLKFGIVVGPHSRPSKWSKSDTTDSLSPDGTSGETSGVESPLEHSNGRLEEVVVDKPTANGNSF